MFLDARGVKDGSELDPVDICIVGGGAAGITLALELRKSGGNIVVLESGSFTLEAATQNLYGGRNIGRDYFSPKICRLRYLGGSTNHWGGMCRPLDEDVFREGDWIPHSGGPFSRGSIEEHYRRAQRVCKLGPYEYDAEYWEKRLGVERWRFDPSVIETRIFQFRPTRFGWEYRQELDRATNLRVFTYANVTEIRLAPGGGSVSSLEVATLAGDRFSVRPRYTVLAAGGLENVRLLLQSNRQQGAGVGNAEGLVGRFFMEHLDVSRPGGRFHLSDRDTKRSFYAPTDVDGVDVRGTLSLNPKVAARERIAAFNAALAIVPAIGTAPGVASLRSIREALASGTLPDDLGVHVRNVIQDLDIVTRRTMLRLASRDLRKDPPIGVIKVLNLIEQVPNPDSRVTLSDEKDALGQPRIEIDWRLTEIDKRTLRRANELLGAELGRLGLGRLRMEIPEPIDAWPTNVRGAHHHIGTTRMHDNPRRGVVDRNARVHGLSNLFVAGSSIFPTGGYANPTLTIVALSLRLADHLRSLSG